MIPTRRAHVAVISGGGPNLAFSVLFIAGCSTAVQWWMPAAFMALCLWVRYASANPPPEWRLPVASAIAGRSISLSR